MTFFGVFISKTLKGKTTSFSSLARERICCHRLSLEPFLATLSEGGDFALSLYSSTGKMASYGVVAETFRKIGETKGG